MPDDTKNTYLPLGKSRSVERQRYLAAFRRQYDSCNTGLHFCGFTEDDVLAFGPHFTILNLATDVGAAREAFARFKGVYEVKADEGDVLVDLQIIGDTEDNFWAMRQMVEPMQRSVTFAKR